MSTLYGQLMTLYLFIFAGWLLGKAKKDAAEKSSVLSFVLVNLFLPAKVFLNFATNFTVSYVQTNYMTLFIATGILLVLVVLGHNVPKLLTKNSYERKVYNYSTSISNYAYFGYVLVEQVLGPAAMNNLMVFCIPFSIYCYTAGVAMLKNQKLSIKTLFNTVTVSLAAGIAVGLSGWTLPAVMQTVLKSAGSCMGPVSMVLVGLVLSTFSFKDLLPSLGSLVFCVIRLGLAPLAVYGICKGLALVMPLPEAVYPSAVLMAAMPCGLNPVVFPKLVGQDCRPGAKLILLTSVVSLVTIPFWLQMLT
jgi:predicted permease